MGGGGAAAGDLTRSVPVGVLVPCSGSNRIDDTLACTLAPADVGTRTVLICEASSMQVAALDPAEQEHWSRAPLCTT